MKLCSQAYSPDSSGKPGVALAADFSPASGYEDL